MIRLVNQFDSSEHLPSNLVAPGGGGCCTTSSCSCIVSAVVASVVSARMVPKLKEDGVAVAKVSTARTVLSAAIIPFIILSLFLTASLEFGGFLGLPLFIYIGFLIYVSDGAVQRGKFIVLHILLIAVWAALSVAEMFGWMAIIF